MEGYGLYWYCLELISANVDRHHITFELEHDAELIAHDTGIHYERVQEMMGYMIEQALFENNDGIITCMKLAKRIDQSMTSDTNFRRVIKDLTDSHDSVMTLSGQNHEKSCKKIEGRSKKVEGKGRFTPPTLIQVKEYCLERNNDVDPQKFIDHYQANGWMRGKSKVKDWKACVRTWERQTTPPSSYGEGGI